MTFTTHFTTHLTTHFATPVATMGAAVALSACLLAAPAALAQQAPPGDGPGFDGPDMPHVDDRGPGPGFGMPPGGPGGVPFLRGLDLSEAQDDRVFAILHAEVPQRRELEKAERRAHDALHALGGGDKLDEARAASAAQALGQAIAGQELLQLRTDAQLMALLTPQQRAQLEQRRKGREQREGRARPDGQRGDKGGDKGGDKSGNKGGDKSARGERK